MTRRENKHQQQQIAQAIRLQNDARRISHEAIVRLSDACQRVNQEHEKLLAEVRFLMGAQSANP